jgi:hypothetical protein
MFVPTCCVCVSACPMLYTSYVKKQRNNTQSTQTRLL